MNITKLPKVRKAALPKFVPPQLATPPLVKEPPPGDEWLHELKFDGYRMLCRIDRGRVTFWSRNGKRLDREIPECHRGDYPNKIIYYTYDAAGNRASVTIVNLNPAPSINSLESNNAVAGDSDFTLTVNEAGLLMSQLCSGTSDRATTFVNDTKLTATGIGRPRVLLHVGELLWRA